MEASKYLFVGGKPVAVSDEVYSEFYRYRRREKTLEEKDSRRGLLRYDSWDNSRSNGAEAVRDPGQSVEELITERETHERLCAALCTLSSGERELINALYYDGEPIAAMARRIGVPQRTLGYRRDRALKKLKAALGDRK